MRALFSGRRRRIFQRGRELAKYRDELSALTRRIDALLVRVAQDVDALRRREIEPEEAVARLTAHEEKLDEEAEALRAMMAPEDLHGLHMEYEVNLERALRGLVTVERGCAIMRLPHRPPEDEEPSTYFKRGHGNVTHARMRMAEIADVLVTWEPGKPAEVTVSSRLYRDEV